MCLRLDLELVVAGARCAMKERNEAAKEAVLLMSMGHKHTLRFQKVLMPKTARWCTAIGFANGGDARKESTRREGCPIP